MGRLLTRQFFDRPVLDVARDLLGATLEHHSDAGVVVVRLTEVEAYDGERDPGSHAFRGRTRRNATMFGPPGHAYVYFTYGMHFCANLVCGPVGNASAVLLRAGQVVAGLAVARARRPGVRDVELARGPARLTLTLGIDRGLDGADVVSAASPLQVRRGQRVPDDLVRTSPRTGVGGDGASVPWRFYIADEPTVSRYRAHIPRRRPAAT
jgi:DNA-3-methyladenine glycosylase